MIVRSYLLGKRKGLAGLKNRKKSIRITFTSQNQRLDPVPYPWVTMREENMFSH